MGMNIESNFKALINRLREVSKLKNIYGGYILFKNEDFTTLNQSRIQHHKHAFSGSGL